MDCTHERRQPVTFIPGDGAHFAIYGEQDKSVLLCVVAWGLLQCTNCSVSQTVAFVAKPYTDQLVPASSLDEFVSIIGPHAPSDQRAGANHIIAEAKDYRRTQLAQLAHEVILRRTHKSTV